MGARTNGARVPAFSLSQALVSRSSRIRYDVAEQKLNPSPVTYEDAAPLLYWEEKDMELSW